jgi:hypothetical protein
MCLFLFIKHTHKRYRWSHVNVTISFVVLSNRNVHAYPDFYLDTEEEEEEMRLYTYRKGRWLCFLRRQFDYWTGRGSNSTSYYCFSYANADTQLILSFLLLSRLEDSISLEFIQHARVRAKNRNWVLARFFLYYPLSLLLLFYAFISFFATHNGRLFFFFFLDWDIWFAKLTKLFDSLFWRIPIINIDRSINVIARCWFIWIKDWVFFC